MSSGGYRAKAAGSGSGMSERDLEQLLSNIEIVTNVVLQGDAGRLLKVVGTENRVRIKATGRSPLAVGG